MSKAYADLLKRMELLRLWPRSRIGMSTFVTTPNLLDPPFRAIKRSGFDVLLACTISPAAKNNFEVHHFVTKNRLFVEKIEKPPGNIRYVLLERGWTHGEKFAFN